MFGGLSLDSVYIFSGHLEYFTDSWDILGPFDTFCVRLVQFFTVLVSCTKKNLAAMQASCWTKETSVE
jgi:hypothetical protein